MKYCVSINRCQIYDVEVEAQSSEEAEKKVADMWETGKLPSGTEMLSIWNIQPR